MANTKVTQHVIANNAITADQLASAAVTDAKLHSTLDLSGKTLTLPATAIPSASTATTQAASDNSTKLATTAYVTTAIGNLNDSAPTALNTLNELAAALGDDANFSATITTSLASKLPLAGGTMTGDIVLSGAPSSGLHPATKTYTDTADALKLNLSGGTLTGDLILNTTTALQIPAGTTGQRPSAATGQIRWNTTDGAIEVYNGTAWTAVGTGSSNKVLDTFTGDNSTTTFTLSITPANEDAIMVFIDGAYQEKGDYVLTNNSLALGTAPLSGEKIAVHTTTASVHDGTTALNQAFTGDGSTTDFTLSQDPKSENNTQIYINGVYQQKTDYTVTGTTLAFDTAPDTGDIIEVNMFTVATLGNTDTVNEGVSNLYHTTARARGAISVSGNAILYNNLTGVLTANFEEGPVFTSTVTTPTLITGAYGAGGSAGDGFRLNSTDLYGQVDASDKVRIAVAGDSFFNGGNVGIGTTSPDTLLELRKDTASSSYGDYPILSLRNDNAAGYSAIHFQEGSTQRARVEVGNNSGTPYMGLYTTSGASGITIKGGNVGIGTTSPNGTGFDGNATVLSVNGYYRGIIELGSNNNVIGDMIGGIEFRNTTVTEAYVRAYRDSNGDSEMRLAAHHFNFTSGNVGIGTTSPGALLDLETAGNTLDGSYYSTMTINNTGSSTYSGVRFDRSGAARWRVGLLPDDTFQIAKLYNTVDDNAFVIDSSGNVGIGVQPASKLTVSNSSAGDGANIADFRGSDSNQRLIIANFLCGSNEDRVGFIWENQGVALWRQWMDDAGNLRLKTSNPTSNTDGKRIVTTESNIGRTIIESLSIGNVASASADFQGGHGVASAGIQKFNFTIQGDNTWRTVLTNVHDCSFEMTATVGDAQSRDNAAYCGTVSSPAYGVSSFNNIYYNNGGWNTGAFEFRINSAGIDYDIQCRFSSYYSTTNVGSGYLMFKRLY